MQSSSLTGPEWAGAIILFVLLAVAIGAMVRSIRRQEAEAERQRERDEREAVQKAKDVMPGADLCPCGETATRPRSRTRATVEQVGPYQARILSILGIRVPSQIVEYEQYVPEGERHRVCDLHGRSWDAMLARRRIEIPAARRAECEEKIAVDMAIVESEQLMIDFVQSMTGDQQRRAKLAEKDRKAVSPPARQTNGVSDETSPN